MRLLEFFKKITGTDKPKVSRKKKISFSEVKSWVENKRKRNEIKEEEIINLVKKKIILFSEQIKEKIITLENFNVEAKKVEDKFISVVNESRRKYIESLETFIRDLEIIEKEKLSEFISHVNKAFIDFNKKSQINYQKTTILIGKEMADIRDSIKLFSKELLGIFDDNESLVDSSSIIVFIKLKLNQLNQIDKVLEEIREEIAFLEKKITDKEKERKKIVEEIERVKKSPGYLDYLNKRDRIKFFNDEIKKSISELQRAINFKALANFYHIFENEMKIIKEYRDNFEESYNKDGGISILGLLNGSKLNNQEILDKIRDIDSKKLALSTIKQEIKEDNTQNLNSENEKMGNELEELDIEKEKEERRYEKLDQTKEELMDEIKKEIKKLDVDVED